MKRIALCSLIVCVLLAVGMLTANDAPWYAKHIAKFQKAHPAPQWQHTVVAYNAGEFPVRPFLRSPGPGLLAVKATGTHTLAYYDAPIFWFVHIRKEGGPKVWETVFDQPEQMFHAKKGKPFTVKLPEFVVPVQFPAGKYRAFVEMRHMCDSVQLNGDIIPWSPLFGDQTDPVRVFGPLDDGELAPLPQ